MGLVDALAAEDRTPVAVSEFKSLVRAEAERDYLRNAITAEIPRETIQKFFTGQNDDLKAFRELELTPEQIREINHLYTEKCMEVAMLRAERDMLRKQLDDVGRIATQAGLEGERCCGNYAEGNGKGTRSGKDG